MTNKQSQLSVDSEAPFITVITQANEADVEAIVDLINDSFSYQDELRGKQRVSQSEIIDRINGDSFFVVKNGEKVIACVTHWVHDSEFWFGLLAVAKQYRRHGLAKQIICFTEDTAFAKGYRQIRIGYLQVAPHLKRYYERLDYIETGQRFEWDNHTIIEMVKTLG